LLQGETYFEMIRYARARHIWVRTVTNASLLHARDNYKKLIDSGVNEVQISIDGASSEVYEAIRRKGKFDLVTENCRRINAYCRTQNLKRTKMWTVVQQLNVDQLEQLVEYAAMVGFESQVFSLQVLPWGSESVAARNRLANAESRLEISRLEGLTRLGDSLGVHVAFWNTTEKFSNETPQQLCPWPFERAYISSDLRTVPCSMIGNPDFFELGPSLALKEVWEGEEYARFRRSHIEGNPPEICRKCYNS